MSIKKNIGVLVLLLVLLSMSAVSAEDVSINANDTYQTPNEIQKDFTSLQTDIDNSQGAFELTYDVKHGDDEIDNYGISITKTTIINGNGHTIDANGHGSIFVVKDSSVTLTLNDLTLINANPVSDSSGIVSNGGAVYFDGSTLIVNNVNFKNNMVYKYGGAIYTTGTCIVDSSVFDGNDVQFRSQNIDNGGAAIYADNGASLLISNSQIINNHKNMVIRDNNVGDLVDGVVVATGYTKISKSYFRNNSGCYGGAVTSLGYTNAGKNQIIIENSVFDSNRAFQGAAVNVIGSTFKIFGTNFTNNKGVGYGSGNPNVGALLTWYGCEGTISDCNFINNTADNGAAYRLGDDNNGVSSASVDSCTFINNTATNQGGAVYEGGKTGKATLDIKNSTFTNNSAKKEGSAIYSGYTLNIDDDTTFTNNMVYMYYTGTLNIGEIKTFTDLQKAINMVEGDIYLSSNVTMLASEADNFVNGIVVDHLVNLKCDGFTINANNLGRIFNVTSTADKLNIYNANLINGNADIGGAIYNTGSVYAYNTNFINNTAATMGGAVFNNGTLTIEKCIVDNNDITKRTSSDSEDYGGAAIYNWYDSTLFIKNSTISNNLKNYKNGDYVVGAVTSLGKTIISQNSYFVNNSGRWGGAITTSGSSLPGKKVNELSISDSTFSKNGGLYGAGIFIQGSKFSITSCVFDNNTASGKGNMTPNDNNGAAIEVTNTDKAITGTIYKSTFTNNKAQYGGAIDICAGTIKITNSKFINNSADVEGGAIDINALNGNPKVTISGSKFINNSAPLGGAILNIKDLTVKGSTFINNTPNTIFNGVGAGGNLNLNIRTFTDLQNAIGLVTGTLTLNQNVALTTKEAANFTNGITINKDITIDGKGHTIDAKNLGRIFSIGEGFTVTLTNATLINGKATEGGAIYNDGSLTLSDVKLSDNAADSYGGAVFNNGELVVSDSVFDSNDIVNRGSASVDYGGAAIYNWKEGTLKVTNSNFINNIKNYKNGDNLVGAIATIGNATVSGSNFVNNSGRWGGAISATGAELRKNSSTLTVSNTIFKDNSALYAGAVYIWGSNYNIADCVFDNNTAFGKGNMTPNENNGGALVVSQVSRFNEPITGTISGSKFTNNKAQYGGAAYFNKGFVTITDSVFENNVATAEGGAVDFSHASVKDLVVSINNSSFVGNKAPVAGAIFTNVDSKITNSNFINNSALYGGAMFVWGSNYSISNSVFDNNSAFGKGNMTPNNNNGGALVVTQGNIPISGTIINSNFTNNKAQYGGAAWINEGTVDISNSNFINNTATVEAGDIGFEPAYTKITATVYATNFINNTAGVDGGAIYSNGDLRISDSDFDNNKAQKADIIYSNINGLLNINGNNYSNYTENKAPIINLAGIETISSDSGVIITVLDNKTVNVCYGDVVTLHAIITVDGVLVANQDLSFSVYNGEDVVVCKANSLLNGSYVATYKINDVINKTVSIVYDGPEVHINTGILNVSKANPDLTVGALNITVGDLEIITVTGPKDATGLITLTLNGIDYILPIYNGEAKFYFQDLAYGTYDVSASYSGDNHYVAAKNSTVFKVDKVLANLNIHVEDITFGENGLVIITLPSDIDGSIVTVNVNGKVYPVDIENGFGKLPLRELDAGDYTISAVFAGNDKYLPGVSNALLTVSKADPALNVLISDVGYDGVFNINVALTGVDAIGLNGNVIVTVNNKDYSVNIVNGKGTAVGVKLAAGTYDFTAAWAGNDNYNAVGDSGKFSVAKVDSIIDVAVSDIKVGEDAVISVKLLSDATGSVTVTVNGKDYTETVVNGVANVKVADLKAGTYDVAVKYSGDNNYNAAVATSSFTVSKVDSTMDVTVNDIVFGGDLTVDAVLPGDATGEVVITVNGVDYHVSIENGKATGTISGLAAGDYTVAIKYVGDDKYIGVEVAENVNVAKAQPVLGVVIADVDYGNGFVIEATLTGVNGAPLSGNVIVTVAGKEYTVKVTDGKGIVTGDKLAAGTYAFAAAWAGDDNYNIVTENGDFKVNKVDSAIDVAVSDIKVGEDAVISVKLASDATGEVVITVNGEDYTAAIENGVASVTVSDLKAGDYTVTVKYTGDNNYNEATGSAEFSVLKITPEMDVTVEDIVFGEDLIVNAVLPVDATGEVVITVNGVDYHVAIENGVASVTVSGLEAGDYTVEVKYAGDDNYNAAEVTKGVNVAKANPALNVIIDSVDYGNVFTINAVLTGVNNAPLDTNIIVTVNGKNYIVAIVNGKGTFHADKLAAGSYNFNARFAGSNNYNEVSDSGKFNVYKVDSAIGITVKDINVGEDAVITVKLFSDATGELTVTVNGKDYTANVVNGRATVSVSDLKAGNYDVVAKYSGDNNYNAAVATSSFTVSKVDSTMDVTVNDIVFGGDLTVDAVLPGDATGEVVITVNGVDYHVSIENGKATGTISGLAAGDYTVAIKYVGDDKYIGVEVAENVNVAKAQPVLGVVIADVDYGNGFVIEATLTGVNNAPLNGNVIVTVNGKEYTVKVTDGKGIATGDKLAAGTYAFAAAWAGNDNYNIVTENGDFKVNKIDSTVAVNADDIKVGENVTVTVNVPTDATGDVIIIVDGVDYTVAIENGKAVKTIADLKANDYTVTVKYSGDNNYNANQNTTEFTVSKISDYNMNITVPEFKEGVNSTINVVLPKDATGTVTVEIGGKNYTANVTDGVANVIIPGLGVGDYNITTTYSGDAKYDLMTKKGNITVIPNVDVNLDVDDVVMVYHDGTRLVAKLTDYQGKPIVNATIYFNINGVNYARTTDANGTASIALNLESGAYPVIVAYNGSASYSKISKNITVTINPSIIADDLVKMYKNDTKFSAKFLGSDGKVLANTTVKFNINGVLYTRTTNNDGVGSLAINLRPGEYVLTAYNPVTGEQQGFNITVKSLIVTQDLTKYYMNASSFQATIYDKNGSLAVGKNVTFNINGVFYTRTADENGVVSLAINLRPREYIITTIYEELDIGNNVVVLPTLVTSDLNMTYRDGSKFTAQTLDGQGKPLVNQNVTFNVNGRLYFKTTGDDGVASLTINLMSGKYIITSYWNDFQTGNTIIIS